MSQAWQKYMKEGFLAITRYALSILCCTTPLPVSSKQPTTSHLDMLIFVRSETYLIISTLGTLNSMSVTGDLGILKTIPVCSDYNQLIYDQRVLGMDYLDCSNQTWSIIEFKIKGHSGNIATLHKKRVMFSVLF